VKLVLLVKLAPLWEMVRLLLALRLTLLAQAVLPWEMVAIIRVLTLLAQVILQALRLTLLALQKTEGM
jgi:hypothetical protein